MNSRSLQENFPKVYREFFSKSEIVVSAPGSFYWTGDQSDRFGELGLKQKIPRRVYIGLESGGKLQPSWGQCLAWQNQPAGFIRQTPPTQRSNRLAAIFKELWVELKLPPLKIHVINEIPIGAGMGSWASQTAAISYALHLKAGIISPSAADNWSKKTSAELMTNPEFLRVLRASWKMEAAFSADAPSGLGSWSALVSGGWPTGWLTEDRYGSTASHPTTTQPTLLQGDYRRIDQIRFFGFRLDDLAGQLPDSQWPIDVALVNTGTMMVPEFFIRSIEDIQSQLEETGRSFSQLTSSLPTNFPATIITAARHHPGLLLWQRYVGAMGTAGIELLAALMEIIKHGHRRRILERLLNLVHLQYRLNYLVVPDNPGIARVMHAIRLVADRQSVPIGMKQTGAGRGGSVVVVAAAGTLGPVITAAFKNLNRRDPTVTMDYASWLDGSETAAIQTEQHMASGQLAPLIATGVWLVKYWHQGRSEYRVLTETQALSLRRRTDLWLDPLDQSIRLRGQAVTSRELHSQRATIAIMQKLLAFPNQPVAAEHFPAGSYRDRTTVQGKIIGPLKHIFRQVCGTSLPLFISGGLNSRFTVKLNPAGLTIGITEKRL